MVIKQDAQQIQVTSEMKKKAMDFAQRAVKDTYDRFKYDAETRKYKIYLGKLGEEALLKFFESLGFKADIDYEVYPGTESTDETDLIVNGYKIDLKVGSQSFHKRLLVVKTYFDNGHKSDFYVAINFYDEESLALIYGYATQEDVASAPVGKWDKTNPVGDYTFLYEELKPIEEMIDLIRKSVQSHN